MMRLLRGLRTLAATLLLAGAATPALADSAVDANASTPICAAGVCTVRTNASDLLAHIEALVRDRHFDEARPLLAALSQAPGYRLETRFLKGVIAAETGDLKGAEAQYRAILVDDPKQTRVRYELGKTLLAQGRTAAADHQLRLAAESEEIPPEIARSIRSVRNIIRSKRTWSVNVDLGIAPDSNINNATGADTITVLFGTQPIPLTLDKTAKAKSGLGVTGSVDAGLRLPIAKDTLLLVDFDAFGTQYKGSAYDDLSLEFASGPEFKLSDKLSLRAEAVVAQRDFGNRVVSRQVGVKGGAELVLDNKQRLGLQIDARNTDAKFDHEYDGWQVGAYATYERVVARSMIASASLFARRDQLRSGGYSSTEAGALVGLAGELPKGFNFGVSVGGSRAVYDDAMPFFSLDPRRDWRGNARVTIGNRAVRVWGFLAVARLFLRPQRLVDHLLRNRTQPHPLRARPLLLVLHLEAADDAEQERAEQRQLNVPRRCRSNRNIRHHKRTRR